MWESFQTTFDLKTLLRIHTGEKTFKSRTHTGETYKCETCGKAFY